ncbi:MAG: SIR2 family NAD-dependent protein deacylase [Coriobacteriales bacterium]|jgi:NAD-dependent SIR2 family protein deacetylase
MSGHSVSETSEERFDGYRETINSGLGAVRELSRDFSLGIGSPVRQIKRLRKEIDEADAIVIGGGAGLSTSAGLSYAGARYSDYFTDFAREFGIHDMYSGGFHRFPDEETYWAWWSRSIYCNRYVDPPKPVYNRLRELVDDKDYFVVTTNVDHQFQRAGFDKSRLFYTQGDFGVFQSRYGAGLPTVDNEDAILQMVEAQGFVKDDDGVYRMPEDKNVAMRVPTELIPRHPEDGGEVVPHLRSDDTFVENDGWKQASHAYGMFLREHEGKHILFWEIGVGDNTPVIIKYPFWQMTRDNPNAFYACVNREQAFCPVDIEERSACIIGDAGELFNRLLTL